MNRCVFIKHNNCILCKQIAKLPVTGSVLDILTPRVDWWIVRMKFCEVFLWLMKMCCFSLSVSGRSLKLFKYDVSSAPISVHLPVSRFLAGMHSVMRL